MCAVLYYLNEKESTPYSRNMHHIQCYLVTNHSQTKSILKELEEKGFIVQDLERKVFSITDSGKEKLPVLLKAFKILSEDTLDPFIDRARS
jgi:DNA-binding PadR family transcriptional regulator